MLGKNTPARLIENSALLTIGAAASRFLITSADLMTSPEYGVTIAINHATLVKPTRNCTKNQQIGRATSRVTQIVMRFPLPMKLRQVHSARTRWIAF